MTSGLAERRPVWIEPAAPEDCRAIAEVHVESWRQAYRGLLPAPYLASLSVADREALWRRVLAERRADVLVARDAAAQVVGFLAFGASRDDDAPGGQAEVMALYVRPACWSTGAGRRLWLAALRRLRGQAYRTVGLWVACGNERATRFYARAGFAAEPASRRPVELGSARLEEIRYVLALPWVA